MSCVRGFLGLAQFAKSRHVLPDRDRVPFDIRDRPRSLFSGQALAIGPLDCCG